MLTALAPIAVAIVVFASTNIDDILLLAAFFAEPRMTARNVVAGQFLGIGLLAIGSALAAILTLAIPHGWIALLGLAPLALGIRGLLQLRKANDDDDESTPQPRSHSQILSVALVTMANGGDNLGVYIPLFSKNLKQIPIYLVVFAAMTAIWCCIGYWLVRHRIIGHYIRRYGHVLLPFVLIALGIWILSDALALIRR